MGLQFQGITRGSLKDEIVDYIRHMARCERDASHKYGGRRAQDFRTRASAMFAVAQEIDHAGIDLWKVQKEKEDAVVKRNAGKAGGRARAR